MKKEFKEFRILILISNIDLKVLDCALTFCAVCRFEMVSHKPCQGSVEISTSDQGCDMINDI